MEKERTSLIDLPERRSPRAKERGPECPPGTPFFHVRKKGRSASSHRGKKRYLLFIAKEGSKRTINFPITRKEEKILTKGGEKGVQFLQKRRGKKKALSIHPKGEDPD